MANSHVPHDSRTNALLSKVFLGFIGVDISIQSSIVNLYVIQSKVATIFLISADSACGITGWNYFFGT